ncbi:MAG: dihydroneopterin aldolase [Paludibacter sp.]|jgi:dihydroneopterin aldolase|nr:dihydroneopterin aldolase [Paludibacter sp.]
MSKITLKNMSFHAYHGVLEQEQRLGNTFLVTLTYETDSAAAEQSDNLADTLDYQQVYDTVKEQMETPSQLIEHIARRIYNSVAQRFPQIKNLNVKLTKLAPPLGRKVESVIIEIA